MPMCDVGFTPVNLPVRNSGKYSGSAPTQVASTPLDFVVASLEFNSS